VARERKREHIYEEHAYVLDYLLHGRPGTRPYRAGALVQVVGENYFTLLEAVVKADVTVRLYDRIYVGRESRDVVTQVLGRIGYDELTSSAKVELEPAVERIVLRREEYFVNFFNRCQAVTPRMHSLELIPGIGKKFMWQILDEREKRPFQSLEDLQKRANLPKPTKLIARRVLDELAGKSKYRLFTRPD